MSYAVEFPYLQSLSIFMYIYVQGGSLLFAVL